MRHRNAHLRFAHLHHHDQAQPAPVLTPGSVANGATYLSGGLVPGSWAQVQGTGLANVTRTWTSFEFLNLGNNLPTSLSNVQIMVNNTPAAVYYISSIQIDFQVPSGVAGNASVVVINNGTPSNSVAAVAVASAPGLFPNPVNGVNYPPRFLPTVSMWAIRQSVRRTERRAG